MCIYMYTACMHCICIFASACQMCTMYSVLKLELNMQSECDASIFCHKLLVGLYWPWIRYRTSQCMLYTKAGASCFAAFCATRRSLQ